MQKQIALVVLAGTLVLSGCAGSSGPTPVLTVATTAPSQLTVTVLPPTAVAVETQSPTLPVVPTSPSFTPTQTVTTTPVPGIRFAVIGDYGGGGQAEADVANLVQGWQPDFVITLGDNNYPDGSAETIDWNIGQFYQAYIAPYAGEYGQGAEQSRFFPTLGNHDWNTASAQPYLDYFTLPGNERYYDFTWGPVHFFALDSDSREPDGVNRSSTQAAWLQEGLASSTTAWNVVYLHHAPYSSGMHGPTDWAQWPYKEWGADVVLAGHDHTYERLMVDDMLYFVNGVGGGAIYNFVNRQEGSQLRYNDDYGAMWVEVSPTQMTFRFVNRRGELIDTYTLER